MLVLEVKMIANGLKISLISFIMQSLYKKIDYYTNDK